MQCCALRVSGLAKEAAQGHEVGSVAGSRPGYMYNTTHATGEVLLIDMTTLYTLASKIHSRWAEGGHPNRLHYRFMCEHTVQPRGERLST